MSNSQSPDVRSTWMVTFGDLLTLLLCFFVAAISFSPPTVGPVHKKRDANQLDSGRNRIGTESLHAYDRSGTALAASLAGERVSTVRQWPGRTIRLLRTAELTAGGRVRGATVRQVLIMVHKVGGARIFIESCDSERSPSGVQLTNSLMRQFSGRRVGRGKILGRSLGKNCSELGMGIERDIVARISV